MSPLAGDRAMRQAARSAGTSSDQADSASYEAGESVRLSVIQAIKWSFLSEVASKAVTPVVFVILARLLTPEDYGVVAAATMVISFSQTFWEAGMGKAVIQHQGDRKAAANTAFWINNLLGIVVAALLVAISGAAADHIFRDNRVAVVLKVMSLMVFLSAAGSVHTALLRKDMQFRRLFWVRLVTVTAPGLISIPLAWHGMGYWALVAGALTGKAAEVGILWRMSPWRPSFDIDFVVARRLARFGGWVALSGLLGWFYLWADSLFVGMYLGAHELGLYRTGNMFVIMIYGLVFGPLLPVLYSHLSAIQNDRNRVAGVLTRVVRIATFVSVPTAFLLYALAEPIGKAVFGPNWHGIGLVIAVMALTHGYAWIVGLNGEAYRAIGRPDYETKIMASTLLAYSAAYWLSIQYGFEAFLWTRFCMALSAIVVHLWVAHLALALPARQILVNLAKISFIGFPLVLLGRNLPMFGAGLSQLGLATAAALSWTIAYLWLIERNALVPETIDILKHRIHGNRQLRSRQDVCKQASSGGPPG